MLARFNRHGYVFMLHWSWEGDFQKVLSKHLFLMIFAIWAPEKHFWSSFWKTTLQNVCNASAASFSNESCEHGIFYLWEFVFQTKLVALQIKNLTLGISSKRLLGLVFSILFWILFERLVDKKCLGFYPSPTKTRQTFWAYSQCEIFYLQCD